MSCITVGAPYLFVFNLINLTSDLNLHSDGRLAEIWVVKGAFHFFSPLMFVSTNHVAGGWDLSARNWLLTAKANSASRCQLTKIDTVNFATIEFHLKGFLNSR
jgi:hypothetical protein